MNFWGVTPMSKIYKKNQTGFYKLSFYRKKLFWYLVCLIADLLMFSILRIADIQIVRVLFYIFTLIVVSVAISTLYQIAKRTFESKSILTFFKEKNAEKNIIASILSTMQLNQLKDSPHILVPAIEVKKIDEKQYQVTIEKLAGMYSELEKLTEDINSSFKSWLSMYAVNTAKVTSDGLNYVFTLEDVKTDKTLIPKTFKDIKPKPYFVKLQKDLEIKLGHFAIWGRTGSRKSTVLYAIIIQLFAMSSKKWHGANVLIIDGKDEFSAFKTFYQKEKIVSDTEDVLSLLDSLLEDVKARQILMSKETEKRQKIGLVASDIDLQPIVLIADEVGSVVALMDSKQLKKFNNDLTAIIQKGRSIGIYIIVSSQSPAVDVLPQKIRDQMQVKILLGASNSNSDIARMAFGESVSNPYVEEGQGFYIADGITTQPMKFYVPDLYSNGFNSLESFKKAYKLGKEVN